MPTIGQLFEGSLLVLPNIHIERFADIAELQSDASAWIEDLLPQMGAEHVLVYEHGSSARRGGGCGIYHAHIHLVPLPQSIDLDALLEGAAAKCASMADGWKMVSPDKDYIMVQLGQDARFIERAAPGFGSQYIRRRLVELFDLQRDWNWRSYSLLPEVKLLNTLNSWSR